MDAIVKLSRPRIGGRAGDDAPNCYDKHAIVRACQPGEPFAEITEVVGVEETNPATGGATDWLQSPAGEVYIVSDLVFRSTYRLASCQIHPRRQDRRKIFFPSPSLAPI